MGGNKRPTLSQMEKRLRRMREREAAAKKKGASRPERTVGDITMPAIDDELISQLAKMRAITPSEVASSFGTRISVAKGLLRSLERRGIVRLVRGNSHIKIYTISRPP